MLKSKILGGVIVSGVGGSPFSVPLTPDMDLQRGGSIADGGSDTIGGTTEGTPTVIVYDIENLGGGNLALATAVISGETNCSAIITQNPGTPVAPGDLASPQLQITVTPTAAGDWSFVVTIANNDPDENPYNITVLGNAASAGPPGTPTMILDRDFLTLTGSDIDEIDDQSGNGFDLVYASGGKASLSAGVTLDGDSTIRPQNNGFNDGSRYVTAVGTTFSDVFPSNRATIIGVINVDSILALFGAPDYIIRANGTQVFSISAVAGPTLRFRWYSTGTVDATVGISTDTWYVFTARADGTNVKLQVDNGTEASSSGGDYNGSDDRIALFFDGGDAGCFNGNMAYLSAWDGALSGGDVTNMKAYLKGRWPSLNV